MIRLAAADEGPVLVKTLVAQAIVERFHKAIQLGPLSLIAMSDGASAMTHPNPNGANLSQQIGWDRNILDLGGRVPRGVLPAA